MIGELVFLTPSAALVGLAFVLPLAMLLRRERAGARARASLGLRAPSAVHRLTRPAALGVLAVLVAAAAAQPVIRDRASVSVRSDAEVYLTFDVSRSMLARSTPEGAARLDRALARADTIRRGLEDVPIGVATLTNRMMPLLFPTGDQRGLAAVLDGSVRILQPQPARLTAARATQLGSLTLAADRSYYNAGARRRALVVFTDLDTDFFSLQGTLALLRRQRIEPFVVRVARPGETVFGADGKPLAYRPASTVSVEALREAGWNAFEEERSAAAIPAIRAYLGDGPLEARGAIQSERSMLVLVALVAAALVAGLTVPALRAATRTSRFRV